VVDDPAVDLRWSKQRLPASMWKIGMRRRLAGITARQLLVSPSTRTASGLSASSTRSAAMITRPIVSAGVAPAASRKWSGRRRPRSSKKTPLSS
jgi:hypothetical protein